MAPDRLLQIASFIILLGVLIFVHELGHFLVAKALNVKVLRFSIGFGPAIWSFRRGETEYRVAILPLGGYVKMAGDDPGEELAPEDRGRGFLEQSPWRRFAIAAAGPAMNLVFPLFVYFAIAIIQNGKPTAAPVVGSVAAGSPAEAAGLQPDDHILSVTVPGGAAVPIRYFADLREVLSPNPGRPLSFEVERDGHKLAPIQIIPDAESDPSNPVEEKKRGVIGVISTYLAAVVAPAQPGSAGPLRPFDLVVRANGKLIAHYAQLSHALAATPCAPMDLTVMREQPVDVPGAKLSTYAPIELKGVPTCDGARPTIAPADPTVSSFVASVVPGSPAEKAGLRVGDRIVEANGTAIHSWRDFPSPKAGEGFRLVLAGGKALEFVPGTEELRDPMTGEKRPQLVPGFSYDQRDLGEHGARLVLTSALAVPQVPLERGIGEMVQRSATNLASVTRMTVLGIAGIIRGQISLKTVGGPIMLFDVAGRAAEAGLAQFLNMLALISINLGLMNLLPIPVLDGGLLVTSLAEVVTRRQLSLRAREIANLVGIVLLVMLMLVVFKNDIMRSLG
jgi:regulator of sigma E protease